MLPEMSPAFIRLFGLFLIIMVGLFLLVSNIIKQKPSWFTIWLLWLVWAFEAVANYGD